MPETFIQVPLAKMVDLVVNSPEEGVVNFNLLHTVLQVLVNKMNAQDLSVEIRGPDAEKLQNIVHGGTRLSVAEVTIASSKKGESNENVMIVDGSGKGSPSIHSTTVTKAQLDFILSEVEVLKSQVKDMVELPANLGIIEAIQSSTHQSPVLDMYQLLSLSKRVDAAEIGMTKMASMVEDLIKSPLTVMKTCSTTGIKPKGLESLAPSEKSNKSKDGPSTQKSSTRQEDKHEDTDDEHNNFRERMLSLSPGELLQQLVEELAELKNIVANIHNSIPEDSPLTQLVQDVEDMKSMFGSKFKKDGGEDGNEEPCELPPVMQLQLMEERFHDYTDHLEQLDQSFNDEITKLHNQFTDIERDFNEILVKIQGSLPSGDKNMDEPNQCCLNVYQKLLSIQAECEQLADTSVKLLNDKEEKQALMDQMLEQIDLLKSMKADKEDIEEALADKADACTVHRKVSHDQFDSACDELSKGIEDALEKLSQQELMWQGALDNIQYEIGTKLDKMDLGPLREFINNKLKMLQERMKSLAALKKEQEAAGTKSRLLRNVNCISCDKDVVMRKEMDPSLKPAAQGLPPTRSMGPYLAYELDALRKQQKTLPGARNMNNFENAMNAKSLKKAEDHICNRYCGGSHTITTPQQRVTRLGHFLAQWGSEAQPPDIIEEKRSVTQRASVMVQGAPISARSTIVMEEGKRASSARLSRRGSKGSKASLKDSHVLLGSDHSGMKVTSSHHGPLKSKSSVNKSKTSQKIPEETDSQMAMHGEQTTTTYEHVEVTTVIVEESHPAGDEKPPSEEGGDHEVAAVPSAAAHAPEEGEAPPPPPPAEEPPHADAPEEGQEE